MGPKTTICTSLQNSFNVQLLPRFFMPKKPVLTEANLCKEDYALLGTRFKASHVKLIVFWVARKVQKSSERAPNEVAKMRPINFIFVFNPCWA